MKSLNETLSGRFKIGDNVKTTSLAVSVGLRDDRFVVKDIVRDGFGCVLLKEKGGRGYGEEFLEKIK